MKIIKNKAVYIQKKDLLFLRDTLHTLPQSISSKIFENEDINPDDFSEQDFFRFDDEEDMAFFKSLDRLIDYDSVKSLTMEELKRIGKNTLKKREQITKKLYTMTSDNPNSKETRRQYKILNYQTNTLIDIRDFKTGLFTIPLPKDENGLRKLFRRIFPKKE